MLLLASPRPLSECPVQLPVLRLPQRWCYTPAAPLLHLLKLPSSSGVAPHQLWCSSQVQRLGPALGETLGAAPARCSRVVSCNRHVSTLLTALSQHSLLGSSLRSARS
jgi:hypothetical protein